VSELWIAFAHMARRKDRLRALEAAAAAVRLARSVNDAEVLARALNAYASNLTLARAFEDAAAALAEADALAPAGYVWLRLRITNTKAFLRYLTGDLVAAAQEYELLRSTHLQLGNVPEATEAALNLAENKHLRGQTEKAAALAQKVLPNLRAGRDRHTLGLVLANLCGYLVALGRLSELPAVAREALQNGAEYDRDGVPVTDVIEHSALALALNGDVRCGALLAGYTQVAFGRIGFQREYTEQTTRTPLEALLQERLSPAELSALLAQGAALSPEDAIVLALSRLNE
jgi:hypothetical protein